MIEAARLEALLGYLNFAEENVRETEAMERSLRRSRGTGSGEPWRRECAVADLKAAGKATFHDTAQAETVVALGLRFGASRLSSTPRRPAHLRDADMFVPMFWLASSRCCSSADLGASETASSAAR